MATKKVYEPPTVTVFDADEIVALLGPAQASSSSDIETTPYSPSLSGRGGSRGSNTFGR